MNTQKIKQIIKEEVRHVIKEQKDDIIAQINEYESVSGEVETVKAEIEVTVGKLLKHQNEMEKKQKKLLKDIEKGMKRHDVFEAKADKLIAKMKEELKYKVPRPDYKKLWEEALKKVNSATQNVLNDLQKKQMSFKKAEKHLKLHMSKNEGYMGSDGQYQGTPEPLIWGDDSIKGLFKIWFGWIKSLGKFLMGYGKAVNNLEKVFANTPSIAYAQLS